MIRRTLDTETKVISASTGEVEYCASDQSLDSYREIILARGWKFDLFKKNAPLVDSHNYFETAALLGKVIEFRVDRESGRLINRARFALDVPSNVRARVAFDMVAAGYLRAVSVGFRPDRFATPSSPEEWGKAVKLAGLDAETAAKCRCIYLEQQQVELSVVVLGANPNALVKAFDEGVVSEEQMRGLGLADDADLSFVLEAGRVFDAATPPEQLLLREAVARRIAPRGVHCGPRERAGTAPLGHSPSSGTTASESHAGDDPEARRRAASLLQQIQQREILARLA